MIRCRVCGAARRRSGDRSEDRVGRAVGDRERQCELGVIGTLGGVPGGDVAVVATDLHEVARLEGLDHLVQEVEEERGALVAESLREFDGVARR